MNLLFEAALELQTYFQKQNWKFCIIGGLALVRWGEVRMTQDVDVSLLTNFESEDLSSGAVAMGVDFFSSVHIGTTATRTVFERS